MPCIAQAHIPALPEELASKILQLLSPTDFFNATLACKAFYLWGILSSVRASRTVPREQVAASLLRFIGRRTPMGLKVRAFLFHST